MLLLRSMDSINRSHKAGAKEYPTAENSNVLNRNFDLSVIDHILQFENPEVVHLCSFCSSCYIAVCQIRT